MQQCIGATRPGRAGRLRVVIEVVIIAYPGSPKAFAHLGVIMPLHVQQALGLIGFGLFLGFVSLVWVANLFGVADEHASRIARSSSTRWMARSMEAREVPPEEMKRHTGMALGRYIIGIGFMVIGLLAIGGGVVYLIAPPAE